MTPRQRITGLLLAGASALLGTAVAAADNADSRRRSLGQDPSRDSAQIAELHREWILVGWEKKVGDLPFDFRAKLGRFYDFDATGVVLYDDFDPQRRVARSADAYGSYWKEPFTRLRLARHSVIDGPDVVTGADLASSTLEFAAALEAQDGKIVAIRTRSTLVWHRTGGGWKIVREHNSSTVIGVPEVQDMLRSGETR